MIFMNILMHLEAKEAEILILKDNKSETNTAEKLVIMRRVTEMVMVEWFLINLMFGIQIWMHPGFDIIKYDYLPISHDI